MFLDLTNSYSYETFELSNRLNLTWANLQYTLVRTFKGIVLLLAQQIQYVSICAREGFITPPSGARGGLKENGQNPDSGSKNSENQNNDAIS